MNALTIDGRPIETAWHGPAPDKAPTLVLLHEGLGCVAMWKDFPRSLAERIGYGVFVYSRFGYGKSDAKPLPWPVTYMHDEAALLGKILDAARIEKCVLVGHSDGASIATIHAGSTQDFRVRGLALMAPHFFCEDISITAIEAAKKAYESGDLKARLERYHGANTENAFRGWNNGWLQPAFRDWRIDDAVAHIRVPILIVQGRNDPYGTLAQVALAEADAYCPVDTMILDCGHAPHVERREQALDALADFTHRILALHEGLQPAA